MRSVVDETPTSARSRASSRSSHVSSVMLPRARTDANAPASAARALPSRSRKRGGARTSSSTSTPRRRSTSTSTSSTTPGSARSGEAPSGSSTSGGGFCTGLVGGRARSRLRRRSRRRLTTTTPSPKSTTTIARIRKNMAQPTYLRRRRPLRFRRLRSLRSPIGAARTRRRIAPPIRWGYGVWSAAFSLMTRDDPPGCIVTP